MEAIRIINERLQDSGSGIGDGTIGAVASMASYEVGNFGRLAILNVGKQGLMPLHELPSRRLHSQKRPSKASNT